MVVGEGVVGGGVVVVGTKQGRTAIAPQVEEGPLG